MATITMGTINPEDMADNVTLVMDIKEVMGIVLHPGLHITECHRHQDLNIDIKELKKPPTVVTVRGLDF